MILGLILLGVVLISTGLKNTQHELGQQIQTDMLGQDGFIAWALAIAGLGGMGFFPELRTASRYLLALLFVVLILRNGGVFQQAQQALQAASSAGPAPSVPSPLIQTGSVNTSGSASGSGGGLGSVLGNVASAAIGQAITAAIVA